MPSEAGQKNIIEKLNRAQKCSILEPQNLGSRGGWAPAPPPPPGSAPELVARTMNIPQHIVRFKAGVENRIAKESLYCRNNRLENYFMLNLLVCLHSTFS